MKDYMHKTDKMQTFCDSRHGNKATLRIDQNNDRPFVLRCRTGYGHLFFISHYATAAEAKAALEKITDPLTGSPCCWWTVSGYVFDIPADR